MGEIAYVNGVFSAVGEATISVEDRGFQFGDSIYEVVAAYKGRPFLLDAHLQRLRRSARMIELNYDFEGSPLEPVITEALRQSGIDDAQVYVQLTRGVAPRSHAIPDAIRPTLVVTVRPLPRRARRAASAGYTGDGGLR